VRRAEVGHLFQCNDGERRRVLAIDSGDPVCVLFEGGVMMSVPCGAIVSVEGEASPKAVRTEKATAPVAAPAVGLGAVHSITYHSGYRQRTPTVGDLIDGRLRLTHIMPSDPVHAVLMDARGVSTNRELCGAGSVAVWRYA
jgi:hypothetical protein